jgi:farnesyl-diphosphate farnesyltransferase
MPSAVHTSRISAPSALLGPLLKSVSRSFYLTLRVLPRGLREPVGLAYLLARAADTIADTELIPSAQRLELLLALRARINNQVGSENAASRISEDLSAQQSNPHERVLLQSLPQALELLDRCGANDRREIQRVVTTLTEGMEFDLRTFPDEASGNVAALKTCVELERYTFLVAGCVGDFWTTMTIARQSALRDWNAAEMSAIGIRFGKALQYTNVLRDVPRDLRIGRCYFPEELLHAHGLQPRDLLNPEISTRARPALVSLIRVALEHYEQARRYLLAIPARCTRLRLACLWPILIGLPTLEALGKNANWLDPAKPAKISRGRVKRTLLLSIPSVNSNWLVNRWIEKQMRAVKKSFGL